MPTSKRFKNVDYEELVETTLNKYDSSLYIDKVMISSCALMSLHYFSSDKEKSNKAIEFIKDMFGLCNFQLVEEIREYFFSDIKEIRDKQIKIHNDVVKEYNENYKKHSDNMLKW